MVTPKTTSSLGLGLAVALMLLATPGRPAESPGAVPAVVTNVVLVTNMVVVTNYVVVTNGVPGTNAVTVARTNAGLPPVSWVPPEDGFDWIQLNTGEWLKGHLKGMQERKLDFDSEKLKLMTFDWEDIRQVRSSRINAILYGAMQGASGPIWITPDQVTVGGPEPLIFPRGELQSIAPGGSKERDYWSGKVSVGLAFSSGNTRSQDYDSQINLQRRTPETRLMFDYLGNYSSQNDVTSANNHRVNAEFDYWLSRRAYLILPSGEYFRDPFQNIAHRSTLGGGIGYDLIDRRGLEWNVSTGPAFQMTWFDSVQPGQPTERNAAALTFGSKMEWQITQRIELSLEYRGQYTGKEVGETFHHSVGTLSVDLTKRFDLDVSVVWDRVQNPKPDSTGAVPKQDDFRLIVGLGIRF